MQRSWHTYLYFTGTGIIFQVDISQRVDWSATLCWFLLYMFVNHWYTYIHVYIYIYLSIYIYMCVYIYQYIHIYMYIWYIYIYIYINISLQSLCKTEWWRACLLFCILFLFSFIFSSCCWLPARSCLIILFRRSSEMIFEFWNSSYKLWKYWDVQTIIYCG